MVGTMRATASMISLGASEEREPRLFADTTVSQHNNPEWLRALASCREIFRFFRSDALSPYETIDRSPVNAADLIKRFLRSCCWTLRFQHQTPVSRCERDAPTLRAYTKPSGPG